MLSIYTQPNGKTDFIRVEACGGHACLHKLRASAAGGFGPPTSVMSSHTACSTASRRMIYDLSDRSLRRGATCGPSPGRSCGPPTSVTSSHAAHSTISCCIITRLIGGGSLRRGATCGPSRGEAAARRWLAPSPFGHGIDSSVRSRAEGSAQALRRNAALRQGAAASCRTYVRVRRQDKSFRRDAAVRRSVRRTAHAVQTAFRVRMG